MNKQILRLAIPFIISNLTVPLVGTVDIALMGHLGSTAHLDAIGLGGAIFNFLYWNFAFLRMSTVGLTAQAYGGHKEAEMGKLLGRSLWISLIGAIILLCLKSPLATLSFNITKGEEIVENYALEYFNIRIFAAPATLALYALNGWFVGMQNAKAPMFIAILVNIMNLGFNFFFVLALGMKSEGVAWGTVIAQYSGLTLGLIIILTKYKSYLRHITFGVLTKLKNYGVFFKVNIDIFIRTFAIISVLTWYNVASAEKGNTILGVNVIFLQLIYAFSFFTDGFANASEALIGKYFGKSDLIQLKRVVKYIFIWGFGIAILFTLLYGFAWRPIMHIYTSDTEIIKGAKDYIGWIIAIPLVSISTFVWDGVFLGATATAEQRNATVAAAIIFFIIYITLDNKLNNHALLLGQVVFFGVRGLIQTFLYKGAILNKIDS